MEYDDPEEQTRADRRRALARERQRRYRERHPQIGQRMRVPDDWVDAYCPECNEERRAEALREWRARAVLVRPAAADEVPGWLGRGRPGEKWYPPDFPRFGCRHPRRRADGGVDLPKKKPKPKRG